MRRIGSWRRGRVLGLVLLGCGAVLPVALALAGSLAGSPAVGPARVVAPFDAPDPDVVVPAASLPPGTAGYPPGTAVVFATQGFWDPSARGIQRFAVARSGRGWAATAGSAVALATADTPAWVDHGAFLQAPGVFSYAGRWVLFYAAHRSGTAAAGPTAPWNLCIGVATAPALDATFTSSPAAQGPLLCQDGSSRSTFDAGRNDGGVIDPRPFVDPATGLPFLLFKTGNEVGGPAARLWSVALDPRTGTALAPGAEPRVLLDQPPGTATIENPDMVAQGGTDVLFYSTGSFASRYEVGADRPLLGSQVPVEAPVDYGESFASCDGPEGPCEPSGTALLATDDAAGRWGPGGGSVFRSGGAWWIAFAQWSSRCAHYLYCPPGTVYPSPPPHRQVLFAPIGAVVPGGGPTAALFGASLGGGVLAVAGAALVVVPRLRERRRQ